MGYEELAFEFVDGCADRHPVGNLVTADDYTACMNACTSDVSFQFFGIFQRFPYQGIGAAEFVFELGYEFQAVCEVHFRLFAVHFRHVARQEFHKTVAFGNG